jgi:hypothetical protein
VAINKKLWAALVFLAKTFVLFGFARLISGWFASMWPGYDQWFLKGAVIIVLVPWIWWAAAPALRAFGVNSTDE